MKKIEIVNPFILLFFLFLDLNVGFSQNNVGIGTSTPDPNAILEMQATDKGILIPRMTSTERNNMSPSLSTAQKGLLVFDNDSTKFFYWNGSSWQTFGSGAIGPQGPTGIANVQTFGINGPGDVNICPSSYVNIPGLLLNINLVDSARVNIYTNGGLQWTTNGNGGPRAKIGLFMNNVIVPTAFQTVDLPGLLVPNQSRSNWSFSTTLLLPAGSYLFDVRGIAANDCYNAGANSYSQSSLIIYVFY